MKKLVALIALVFISACSSDDKPNPYAFQSHIMIDGEKFTPSANSSASPTITTVFIENSDADYNTRAFHLVKEASGSQAEEILQINIDIPKVKTNATGTYTFEMGDPAENMFAQGSYTIGETLYGLAAGSVSVTEYSDHATFEIVFNDVQAVKLFSSEVKNITGHFKAKFIVQEP